LKQIGFSIVIPSHNRPKLILNAVQSALENCTLDSEVIVVDDRSNIPVENVLVSIGDSRLKVIRNNELYGGAAHARNIGVEAAKYDLVFFLDDDDIFTRDYIQYVLAELQVRDADYGFGKDCLNLVDCKSNTGINSGFVLVDSNDFLKKRIAGISTGFWVKRNVFLNILGFDLNQIIDEDTDLCVRFTLRGSKCLVYQGYATIRNYHSNNISQLTKNTELKIVLECYKRTFDKSAAALEKSTNGVWYLGSRYIRRAINAGFIREAYSFCLIHKEPMFKYKFILFFCKKAISFFIKN
jgi:glycosyltransferase involved in cell wall biosynthesis